MSKNNQNAFAGIIFRGKKYIRYKFNLSFLNNIIIAFMRNDLYSAINNYFWSWSHEIWWFSLHICFNFGLTFNVLAGHRVHFAKFSTQDLSLFWKMLH